MNKDNHINESIINDEVRAELKKERIDHMAYLPDMEVIPSDILDKVIADMDSYDYDKYTAQDVQTALSHDHITPEDFRALLSPAALPFLEQIAQKAQKTTKRFLVILSICSHQYILPITAKIIVSIVVLTVIIKLNVLN